MPPITFPLIPIIPPAQPGFVPPTVRPSTGSTGSIDLGSYLPGSSGDSFTAAPAGLDLSSYLPPAVAAPGGAPTAGEDDPVRGLDLRSYLPPAAGPGGTATGNADLAGFAGAMSAGQEGVS